MKRPLIGENDGARKDEAREPAEEAEPDRRRCRRNDKTELPAEEVRDGAPEGGLPAEAAEPAEEVLDGILRKDVRQGKYTRNTDHK